MSLAPVAPSVKFQERYAYQALESAVARGEPEIYMRGTRGCGKTILFAHFCYRLARDFPGMAQIWLRKHRSDMDDTVIAAFEDEVLGIGHPLRGATQRSARKGYDVGNGSRINLRGIYGPDAGKSLSCDLIWVCEGSELTESEFEEIGVSKRPRVGATQFPYQCIISDFNPMPPAHWTNTRCAEWPKRLYPRVLDDGERMGEWFTPEMYAEAQEYNLAPLDRKKYRAKMIVAHHADNPGYWSIDPWGWTSAGRKYCRDTLSKLTGNRRGRYLEGRPMAVEGVVFDDFDRDKHVIVPFKCPADWPVYVQYDPGYRHPCAVNFVGIAPNGQPFFIDEIHEPGIGIDSLGPMIKHKASKYRVVDWLDDPYGANQKTQIGDGITVREYMRRKFQLYFRPWKEAKGPAKHAMVESLRAWLNMPKPLQIFDTCTGIISNFESWMNKTNKDGSMPDGDERYEDRNNDGLDGLMGLVAEKPTFKLQSGFTFSSR